VQLPPKRRQIVRLLMKRSDIVSAKAAIGVVNSDASEKSVAEDITSENLDDSDGKIELLIKKISTTVLHQVDMMEL
jgi:hypothetical protein